MRITRVARRTRAPMAATTFAARVAMLTHPRGAAKAICVIQAYLDESGIHDGSIVSILAGYIGSVGQWERFESLWPDSKVPFHAKEFFARDKNGRRVKPYDGWTDVDADRYLSKALRAITSVDIMPMGTLIDVSAFNGYSEDYRRHLTGGLMTPSGKWKLSGAPTRPYSLLFQDVVIQAVRNTKRSRFKIHFTFDQQRQFAPHALSLYQLMKSDQDQAFTRQLGDAVFASRAEATPLQAADLLAHCWYRHTQARTRNHEVERVLAAQKVKELPFLSKDAMDRLLGLAPLKKGTTYERKA